MFGNPSHEPLCYTTYKRYAKYEAPFNFAIYLWTEKIDRGIETVNGDFDMLLSLTVPFVIINVKENKNNRFVFCYDFFNKRRMFLKMD